MEPNTNSAVALTTERIIELSTKNLEEWSHAEILAHVRTQFNFAKKYTDVKKNVWNQYTMLYLNQWRKDSSPLSVGSKIVFNKFNEAYAEFSQDEKEVDFDYRKLEDQDIVSNLNTLANYEWTQFNGADWNDDWVWDSMFNGIGYLDVSTWDSKRGNLAPARINPFITYPDPLAPSMTSARYAGHLIYSELTALINANNVDGDKVKQMARKYAGHSADVQSATSARQAKETLLGVQHQDEPMMVGGLYEVLQWYTKVNGNVYRIWTDNTVTILLGYERLKYNDARGGLYTSDIPIIEKTYLRLPGLMLGLGIPDVVEDDHRADVRLKNYILSGVENDSKQRFLYNVRALLNPRALAKAQMDQNIATTQSPNGEIIPFPKSGVVNQGTVSMLGILHDDADQAVGSSRVLRASFGELKHSATAIAVAKGKQDRNYASRAKEMNKADVRFWYTWLNRLRKHSGGATRMVKVLGESGVKELKEFSMQDVIPGTDPEVEVRSRLSTEPEKVMKRRDLAELLEPTAKLGGNSREMLKRLFYYLDMNKEEIANILPSTPHELRAYAENDLICDGKVPLIHEKDDDLTHIAIHQRAEDTPEREAHLQAHVLNFLRKQNLPEPGKGNEATEKRDAKSSELQKILSNVEQQGAETAPTTPVRQAGTAQSIADVLQTQPQDAGAIA